MWMNLGFSHLLTHPRLIQILLDLRNCFNCFNGNLSRRRRKQDRAICGDEKAAICSYLVVSIGSTLSWSASEGRTTS